MKSFLKKLLLLFLQPALTGISNDFRVKRILEKIQIVSFVTSLFIIVISFFMSDDYTMKLALVSALLFMFFSYLTKMGLIELSALLSSFYLVGLVSFGMFTSGEGIHDEILLILPAFFLLGSLFLNDLMFFTLVFISLTSVSIIGKLQMDGRINLKSSIEIFWHDIAITVILLGGVVFVMRLITKNLLKILLGAIESEQDYRKIFNASNEAIFIHDATTGEILDVNDAMLKIYKYSKDEIMSMSVKDYDFASGKGEFNSKHAVILIKKAIEEGPQLFEWQAKKSDGTIFWVEVSLSYSDGRVIAVVRDINEKKKIELELTQRDKMRAVGQLAGGIAHDFNNQLSGIIGFAEVIKMESKESSMKSYADHILSSAEASSHQIKQLLSFARKNKQEQSQVNINKILKHTSSLLEKSIDRKINIKLKLHSDPLWIQCDVAQIENAFLNLAINARDAMPEGGTITIKSEIDEITDMYGKLHGYQMEKGLYAKILIEDTGIGIPIEIREKIFEPFFTTKASGKGTGMGLSAVYGTVKSHKGGINIISNSGEGTVFEVYLPLVDSNMGKKTELIPIIEYSNNDFTGEGLAYVIDDEPSVRALAKKHLNDLGFNPKVFEDGNDAVKEFKSEAENVKFVLLDMIMPHISGEDIFYFLKSVDPKVKVIIVSGFSLNQSAQNLLEEGAIAYIQKPYKRSDLVEVIKGL